MKRLDLGIAVWGEAYVGTMLTWALPSFLAPGNLPACAKMIPVRTTIVTRPEDVQRVVSHPVAAELRKVGELNVVPLLTPDKFERAGRYDVMALSHRYCIVESLRDGSISALAPPDWLMSDDSLSFGLRKILEEGKSAVLVAGPRAELEPVTAELTARAGGAPGISISLSGAELSSLVARHPHEISRLLFWDDQPFNEFPSAIYWRAGEDSFLARYFHLHPLLVDFARAAPEAAASGTIDGTLITSAQITPEQIYVVDTSEDVCVIEMSRIAHDPMGSLPIEVSNKQWFVAKWAIGCTDATHREQFKRHFFRFQGLRPADWNTVIARSRRDTARLDRMLDYVGYVPRPGSVGRFFRGCAGQVGGLFGIKRRLAQFAFGNILHGASLDLCVRRVGQYMTWLLTPTVAALPNQIVYALVVLAARVGVRATEVYGRLTNQVLTARRLGNWANRPLKVPDFISQQFQDYYDCVVIPERGRRPGPFTRTITALARAFRIVFVANVAPGTGHNTVEVDLFLRRLYAGELDPRARYVFIRLPTSFHIDTVALYRRHFWFASSNRILRNILMPTMVGNPDLRLDCGLSRLKWHLREDGTYSCPPSGQTFLYQVSKEENRKAWLRYYQLRALGGDIAPLSDGVKPDQELLDFLGGNTGKLALFHSKLHVANATTAPTRPEVYLASMRYLQEKGYRIVHVGREAMPEEFKALGVLNYAESDVASYRHDLQLFACCKIAVTAGSGVALLPDCMGVPLVYCDSWHIGMPMASQRSIMLPTLVEDNRTGRTLTFQEQIGLYFEAMDKGDEIFPAEAYTARNAAAEDVLAAVKEVLAAGETAPPFSPLQEHFRALDASGLLNASRARVSEAFLRKHADLLASNKPQEVGPIK